MKTLTCYSHANLSDGVAPLERGEWTNRTPVRRRDRSGLMCRPVQAVVLQVTVGVNFLDTEPTSHVTNCWQCSSPIYSRFHVVAVVSFSFLFSLQARLPNHRGAWGQGRSEMQNPRLTGCNTAVSDSAIYSSYSENSLGRWLMGESMRAHSQIGTCSEVAAPQLFSLCHQNLLFISWFDLKKESFFYHRRTLTGVNGFLLHLPRKRFEKQLTDIDRSLACHINNSIWYIIRSRAARVAASGQVITWHSAFCSILTKRRHMWVT